MQECRNASFRSFTSRFSRSKVFPKVSRSMNNMRFQLACFLCLFWCLKAPEEAPGAEKLLGLCRSSCESVLKPLPVSLWLMAQGLHCVTSAWCNRVGCREPCAKVLSDFELLGQLCSVGTCSVVPLASPKTQLKRSVSGRVRVLTTGLGLLTGRCAVGCSWQATTFTRWSMAL